MNYYKKVNWKSSYGFVYFYINGYNDDTILFLLHQRRFTNYDILCIHDNMDFDIIFQLNGFNKNRENKIMNTHETYVSFETAKLLKAARFDWECTAFYGIVYYLKGTKNIVHPDAYSLGEMDTVLEDKLIFGNYKNNKDYNNGCAAPTLCVAQIWLREKYNLFAMVEYDYRKNLFRCKIYSKAECLSILFDYSTYEEALEAGIHKALKIILKKGE